MVVVTVWLLALVAVLGSIPDVVGDSFDASKDFFLVGSILGAAQPVVVVTVWLSALSVVAGSMSVYARGGWVGDALAGCCVAVISSCDEPGRWGQQQQPKSLVASPVAIKYSIIILNDE